MVPLGSPRADASCQPRGLSWAGDGPSGDAPPTMHEGAWTVKVGAGHTDNGVTGSAVTRVRRSACLGFACAIPTNDPLAYNVGEPPLAKPKAWLAMAQPQAGTASQEAAAPLP